MCAALLLLFVNVPLTRAAAHASNAATTPISVYGAWACSNDQCFWGTVRSVTEFDSKNHWLIDRGDGVSSVNLVVLSFVQPLKLLNKTTDSQTSQGVPVGMAADIEIDYENSSSPNLTGLQAFIDAYRSVEPYDATGANPAARLTIDLAAGDRWLISLATKATTSWLTTSNPVLDYATQKRPGI